MLSSLSQRILQLLDRIRRRLIGERCLIWRDCRANIQRSPGGTAYVDSPRAGGRYEINSELEKELWRLDNRASARLTTWLVDQRLSGVNRPIITADVIIGAIEAQSLPIIQRADRLLRFIINSIQRTSDVRRSGSWMRRRARNSIRSSTYPMRIGPNTYAALDQSESVNFEDIRTLLEYLQSQNWVSGKFWPEYDDEGNQIGISNIFHCRATVQGIDRVENLVPNAGSRQAFIAMWFDPAMDDLYDNVIKPAIESTGYRPYCVNRELGVDKIVETVKEEISRSRFMVADVTHGSSGPRASVYYEIGYAHARNIEVIFTCSKVLEGNLPFDTSQHTHFFWEANHLDQLRDRLYQEIKFRFPLR